MKSKTKSFAQLFFILIFIFLSEVGYLYNSSFLVQKRVSLVTLPNLAVSTDNLYLRVKSYASVGDVLKNDGELPDSSSLGFVY